MKLAWILALLVGLAVALFLLTPPDRQLARGEGSEEASAKSPAESPGNPPLPPLAEPTKPPEVRTSQPSEPDPAVEMDTQETPATARRIPGLLVYPPGTPSDEKVTVFWRLGGEDLRTDVAADGSFELTVPMSASTIQVLRLQARFLYLEEQRYPLADKLVLRPRLGAHVHGKILTESLDWEELARLQISAKCPGISREFLYRWAAVGEARNFEFDGLPPGDVRLYVEDKEIAPWLEEHHLVPGRSYELFPEIELSVRVEGRLLAPDGAPLDEEDYRVHITYAGTTGEPRTLECRVTGSGEFSAIGMPSGILTVTCTGQLTDPIQLSTEPGDAPELEIPVARLGAIAGTLAFEEASSIDGASFELLTPDGRPVEEPIEPFEMLQLGENGIVCRFELHGLPLGAEYALVVHIDRAPGVEDQRLEFGPYRVPSTEIRVLAPSNP